MITGFFLIFLGFTLILIDVLMSSHQVMLFVIFPVIIGRGSFLSLIGVILIFIGMLLLFLEPFLRARHAEKHLTDEDILRYVETKRDINYEEIDKREESAWGGVIFIGPFPIAFGAFRGKRYKELLKTIGIILGVIIIILTIMFIFKQ